MDLRFSYYVVLLCCAHCTGQYFGEIGCDTHSKQITGCEPPKECTVSCPQCHHYGHLKIFGTRIYSSNSPVCYAAYHDYRLSPHVWRTNVTLVPYNIDPGKFLPSIQRGDVTSNLWTSHNGTFNFTSPYLADEIFDIAVLNYNYLYQGNSTFIQLAQISDKERSFDFIFYIRGSEKKQSSRKSGGWLEIKWTKPHLQPGGFWCHSNNIYSNAMTMTMSSNADFLPEQWTITRSIQENVVIKFTQRQTDTIPTAVTWKKDQRELYSFPNMKRYHNKSGYYLEIENVDVGDGGIYSLEFDDEKEEQGVMRLIVRRCPKNYYGRKCNRLCPDCKNGGVCHDIMGTCICAPGFNGSNCETRCRTGYFGRSCSLTCSSSEHAIAKSCKGALICLPDPYGCSCSAEYKGLACNVLQTPSQCDQQKLEVCNMKYPKLENCGKVKGYQDCLTVTASCPVERVEKIIKQLVDLNRLDCVPFEKEEKTECSCQKSIQEKTLDLLAEMETRMQEDREYMLRFQGELLQQLERITAAIFKEDNFLPLTKADHDAQNNDNN